MHMGEELHYPSLITDIEVIDDPSLREALWWINHHRNTIQYIIQAYDMGSDMKKIIDAARGDLLNDLNYLIDEGLIHKYLEEMRLSSEEAEQIDPMLNFELEEEYDEEEL